MSSRQLWVAVLVAAALLRLVTLPAYPLHDTTEARYAEIARLMVISDNWITPQIEPGVPFWAKPPLSTWTTAASFKLFGFNEFAARLPSFLLSLLSLGLMFKLGRKEISVDAAIAGSAILMTSAVGFIAAGAVMTDAALLLSTTLSLVAFWIAAQEPRSPWRYVFFAGLALGLLAKGPIALVLVGLPILAWSLWHKNVPWLWRALPWFRGSVLMLAIACPWYVMAEIRTPGFLEYFFVGEHWLRFVESGWEGDLYGEAHAHLRGTIWLYGLLAALPWSLVALYAGGRAFKTGSTLRSLTPFQAYLLLWALMPLVFFTLAGNILAAYVLPGLPAFGLLLGNWLARRNRNFAQLGWLVPGLLVAVVMSGWIDGVAYRSQKDLIDLHYAQSPSSDLRYFPKAPSSASFYSAGRVQSIRSLAEMSEFVSTSQSAYVAMRKDRLDKLADDLRQCLHQVRDIHRYAILQKKEGGCD